MGLTTKQYTVIESTTIAQGDTDDMWIDPRQIVEAQWDRVKCMFGCGE